MFRAAFWFFLTALALGFALCVTIVVQVYTDSHPGAKMYLMGFECLAAPMAGCAAILIALMSSAARSDLKWWESRLGWIAGSSTFAIFGVLFVLG